MNLPVLSNEDTKAADIKPGPQTPSDVYDDTVSTLCTENEEYVGVTEDVSRKASLDHSYTRWDQTIYCCMYCKKTVIGKDNLASHQTASHPDKVFCCPECDIIIYESKQFFEEHRKTHLRKSDCDEDTFKVNWHTTENSCFEEGNDLVPDNGSINEVFNYKKIKKNTETHKTGLLEADLDSGTILSLKIPELDLAHLPNEVCKQTDRQSVVEIVQVADIRVEPERSILKKGSLQSNSKFRVKISKNFETIDDNLKSKIIGTIRGLIKESQKERIKVTGTEVTSKESEEVQRLSFAEEISPQNKMKKEMKLKRWKCKQCDHVSVSWEEHLKHVEMHPPVSFPCAYCDKQFSSKTRLQFHTSVHTQDKPFICEYCGKSFRNRQSLKNHLYTHDEGEKMFECQDCGKKFGTRGGYDSHCASHTKASYLCDLCGKSMKHISSLRLHRLIHIDPDFFRRHCCAVCGKTCRNR
jgi:RNase P subunit RPR2